MAKRPRRPATLAEVAKACSVSERTVRRWVSAGCPVRQRGKAGRVAPNFDLAAVDRWRSRNQGGAELLAAAIRRRLDAQSRGAARKLAQLEAEYLPLDQVIRVRKRLGREVRTRILRLPDELTPRVLAVNHEGVAAIERVLRDGIHQALRDLAGSAEQRPVRHAPRPRPVRVSKTVQEARTQLANFQAAILDLKEAAAAGEARWAAMRGRAS